MLEENLRHLAVRLASELLVHREPRDVTQLVELGVSPVTTACRNTSTSRPIPTSTLRSGASTSSSVAPRHRVPGRPAWLSCKALALEGCPPRTGPRAYARQEVNPLLSDPRVGMVLTVALPSRSRSTAKSPSAMALRALPWGPRGHLLLGSLAELLRDQLGSCVACWRERFADISNGERYRRFRINFESTELPEPCRGCGLMWSL